MRRTNEEFGRAFRQAYEARGFKSVRQAAIRTGLDHATVHRALSGVVPGMVGVVKWAQGIGAPVNRWLILAGYPPVTNGDTPPSTESPETAPSAPPGASDARDGILVPPQVHSVIREALDAGDADTAINEAILFIRRPEHREVLNFSAGASGGDKRPGKLGGW